MIRTAATSKAATWTCCSLAIAASGFSRGDAPAVTPAAQPQAAAFWAFQKPSPPPIPKSPPRRDGTPVDAFVVARLVERGLELSPAADRATLVRRASLDLVGLPPSPEEIDAFVNDPRTDAYERLVDRLLASPHFGERWGRHWLDAAGYSDIAGGDNDAGIIKLSSGKWKYRDYVVRSFNSDKPYDRFLIEQLAGDELVDWRAAASFTPETKELLVATGFLRNAADDTDEKELRTADIMHGILQRTAEVVANNALGLTLACAKCHDHKYEPISQQDYYRLLAVFAPAFNPGSWVPPNERTLADIAPAEKSAAEKHNAEVDRQIADLKKQQAEIRMAHRERIEETRLATLPEAIRADVRAAVQAAAKDRSEVQQYLAEKFETTLRVSDEEVAAALGQSDNAQLADADRRVAELENSRRTWGAIQAAYDVGPASPTRVLLRGNHETPGDVVEPGFLSVLGNSRENPLTRLASSRPSTMRPAGATSGRRLAFARWLSDWDSPAGGLAARVMVNRVWQHLFGRGIVETSENMGISGAQPTHRELLEWLAGRFVSCGARVKPLIRLLVTSNVYRQASAQQDHGATAARPGAAEVDPANDLLWRMPLKRLEAEIVRDSILSASGQLDLTLGGPSLPVETRADGSVVIKGEGLPAPSTPLRRSLYVLARRNYHLSMLGVFDQPAMSTNCPRRDTSAVVLQSLAMLNDSSVLEPADAFARRVEQSAKNETPADQIELAFRIALGRSPSESETTWSGDLVAGHRQEGGQAGLPPDEAAHRALVQLCHMLLGSNEFLYVP